MKKRIISFLLVLCLLAGMVPMMVPQADAIIGSVLKYGLKTCVAVVKGTITTCQNIDHYNGNVGKAVLGQFKNIGAELTGLDIGEDYGDGGEGGTEENTQVIDAVSMTEVKETLATISGQLEKNNAAIHQLETTVTNGLQSLSQQMEGLSKQIKDQTKELKYSNYLNSFFEFFNEYYEAISYYDQEINYAISGNSSDDYIKNLFDQFYHLQNVEYNGNLHSAVSKLGRYLRGEYLSSDPGSVVDILSQYYILAYEGQGKSKADACKLAAQDTEEMISYIYYAYCMGIYYEEMVALYQATYMEENGTNEYRTDFGSYISSQRMETQVEAVMLDAQSTVGCILGALLDNYPREKTEIYYCSEWYDSATQKKHEYSYTRPVTLDGFTVKMGSSFSLPDAADTLSSYFSDDLRAAFCGVTNYAAPAGAKLSVNGSMIKVWPDYTAADLERTGVNENIALNICVGERAVSQVNLKLEQAPLSTRYTWDGDGSPEFPYLIVDWHHLSDALNNSFDWFVLGQDLQPSGSEKEPLEPIENFYGIFDGNGCTIRNFKITEGFESTDDWESDKAQKLYCAGLFANLYGTVRNLNLDRVTVDYDMNYVHNVTLYAGAIAGSVRGGSIYRCLVEDSAVDATATVVCHLNVGGIAGGVFAGGSIDSCTVYCNNSDSYIKAEGQVSSSSDISIGGIVGAIGRDSRAMAFVSMETTGSTAGGFALLLDKASNTGSVSRCQVMMTDGQNIESMTTRDDSRTGGIAGVLVRGSLRSSFAIFDGGRLQPKAKWSTGDEKLLVGLILGCCAETASADSINGNFDVYNRGSRNQYETIYSAFCGNLDESEMTKAKFTDEDDWKHDYSTPWGEYESHLLLYTMEEYEDAENIEYFVLRKGPDNTDALITELNKTTYTTGEYLNLSGLVIRAADGAGNLFRSRPTFKLTEETKTLLQNPLTAGTHTLTFQLNNGLELSTEIQVKDAHIYFEQVTPATCLENGSSVLVCVDCGATRDEKVLPALGHKEVTDPAVPPTCSSDGLTEGSHCERCGEVLTAQTAVPTTGDHGHTIVPGYPATCTTDGLTDRDWCEGCGLVHQEATVIPATGHSMKDTVVLAPTCTAGGMMQEKCETCGAYGDLKNLDPLGHAYAHTVVEPTCDEPGYTDHTCPRCGDSYTDSYVAPTGHTYDDGVVTREPSCTQEGEKTYTCSCGKTHTEPIAKLPHSYEDIVLAPTCTEVGYTRHTCSVCGDTWRDKYVGQLEHDWDAGVITLSPTLTTTGVLEQHCKFCGETKELTLPALSLCDATNCPSSHLTDVPERSHWAHEGIDYMLQLGLVKGMSATTFEPETAVTRAMLVTILYRYAGSPEVKGTSPFTDVKDGMWYAEPIIWASENGIVLGVGDGAFEPDGEVTRQQIATILYRFAKANGVDVSCAGDLTGYVDANQVADYAKDAISWACGAGLINGVPSGGINYLQPEGFATRAQMCTIFMRYIRGLVK